MDNVCLSPKELYSLPEVQMGLDLLELVLTVEDTFGFPMPDEDAVQLNTVGKLYEYILAHRFHGKQEICVRSMTFYKIRRAMMAVLKIPRKDIKVSTELSAIIPVHRRRIWRALEKATNFRLPQLRRPGWVTIIAVFATMGLAIAAPVFLSLKLFHGAVAAACLTAAFVGWLFAWLTTPLTFEFQPECTTVGQLATATLARNYRTIVEEFNREASDAEVWEMLRLIVAEQLGVRPSEVTKEADFVKDLNAG
jgi:acyl carrier protein